MKGFLGPPPLMPQSTDATSVSRWSAVSFAANSLQFMGDQLVTVGDGIWYVHSGGGGCLTLT